MAWYSEYGEQNDVVLSTRVRLARNLKKVPFAVKMTGEDDAKVINYLEQCTGKSALFETISNNRMKDLSIVQRQVLVEKHLISPELMNTKRDSCALISDDERISILVNEEDHFRIQCLLGGLQLEEAYKTADKIDDLLDNELEFAFDEHVGYLTCCPTNTGTGMRASVMAHLPALSMSGRLNNLIAAIVQMGIAVRGLYGEGSAGIGNFFQISNQVTLGVAENDTVEKLKRIVLQIVQHEKDARIRLVGNAGAALADKVWRAYGVMANARQLQNSEFMKALSDVRLGASVGILNLDVKMLDELMVEGQPANIIKRYDIKDINQCDIKRSDFVRQTLEEAQEKNKD